MSESVGWKISEPVQQSELQTGVFGTGPAAVDSGSRSRSGTCSIPCCGSDSLLLLSSSGILFRSLASRFSAGNERREKSCDRRF